MKPVHFMGSSRDDLRGLSVEARESAGYQLFKVQQGKEPDDWKPLSTIGAGSTKSECGPKWELQSALRSEFDEAVYVLHVFEKRSQRTPKDDIYLARQRYTDLIKWRKEQRL